MPLYKSYPQCPWCNKYYKSIPDHIFKGKSGSKGNHVEAEMKNPKLPKFFKDKGVEAHVHLAKKYDSAKQHWVEFNTPEHYHDPATKKIVAIDSVTHQLVEHGSKFDYSTSTENIWWIPDHKHDGEKKP
jgi:hypothetical protein